MSSQHCAKICCWKMMWRWCWCFIQKLHIVQAKMHDGIVCSCFQSVEWRIKELPNFVLLAGSLTFWLGNWAADTHVFVMSSCVLLSCFQQYFERNANPSCACHHPKMTGPFTCALSAERKNSSVWGAVHKNLQVLQSIATFARKQMTAASVN